MRVLLYDVLSRRYYQAPAGWTADAQEAHDLGGTVQAVDVAYRNKLISAEIILAFDEPHLGNMSLPLRVAPCPSGLL
jgi:hypothetical protein